MPYLIFIFGIIIGTYAFLRYFINAKPYDIKLFFKNALIGIFVLILLYFAMSGRIMISLAILVISMPFIVVYYKEKKKKSSLKNQGDTDENT